MTRPSALATLAAVALTSSGCQGESLAVTLSPETPKVFGGTSTAVWVTRGGSCEEAWTIHVEAVPGESLPTWLRTGTPITVSCSEYFIGNPGMSAPAPSPPSPCAHERLVLSTDADVLVGDHAFRVRIESCGREATAPFTLSVVGTASVAGFCGISTSAPCARDEDCAVDCAGQCTTAASASASGVAWSCADEACPDPGPGGALCGCAAGACLWR